MIKPGDVVTGVQVIKSDNCGDDTGREGYDVTVMLGNKAIDYFEHTIDELENEPKGIYDFDGQKYIQIENWEN
jgi:hypothetical protein